MDFIEYMNTKKRMTRNCTMSCTRCALSSDNNKRGMPCSIFERVHPEEAQLIVSGWVELHPLKTRAQDFFEKHPKAPKNTFGDPKLCAHRAGYCGNCVPSSSEVCHKCWNEPVDVEEE